AGGGGGDAAAGAGYRRRVANAPAAGDRGDWRHSDFDDPVADHHSGDPVLPDQPTCRAGWCVRTAFSINQHQGHRGTACPYTFVMWSSVVFVVFVVDNLECEVPGT